MSRGGDTSTAGDGGRTWTGGDVNIPKSSRAGWVGSSSSMFPVFGTCCRSKANGQVFYSREADRFLDSLLWSLGSSLLLL